MCCTLRNIKYFVMLQLSFLGFFDWQVYSAEESSPLTTFHVALRQKYEEKYLEIMKKMAARAGATTSGTTGERRSRPDRNRSDDGWKPRKRKKIRRTTVPLISQGHYCDYIAKPCIHAYVTGKICARTIYYNYRTFDSYCLMDYVNCREDYEVWQMVYAGACFSVHPYTDYMQYVYHDDLFLDNYYIVDDKRID